MKTLALACFAALVALPAYAQGPVGIAFVQAEEGTWWCRAGTSGKAFDCAMKKCGAEAGGQDCHEMRWCGLAAWSGTMVIWLPEFHSTSIICGAPSEAALTAGLKAFCDNDEVVTRCDVTAIIDPDGKEKLVDNMIWPGPTTRQAEPEDGSEPVAEEPSPDGEETPAADPPPAE